MSWNSADKDLWAQMATSPAGSTEAFWGRRVLPSALADARFSFHFACSELPIVGKSIEIMRFLNSDNEEIGTLYLQTTGALLFDHGASDIVTTGPVVVAEKDHHFEAKIDASSGVFQLYVDRTKVLDGVSLTFTNADSVVQYAILITSSQ